MKAVALITFCLSSFYNGMAQQKNLLIDVFTLGHFKRYHISQNAVFTYKLKGSSHRQRHTLVDMSDSTLYIETGDSIRLDEIKKIIIDRSNFLTRQISTKFRIAGVAYIGLIAFNNARSDSSPILDNTTLLVGASIFLVGEIAHIANKKRIRIGKNRILKIVDLSLN